MDTGDEIMSEGAKTGPQFMAGNVVIHKASGQRGVVYERREDRFGWVYNISMGFDSGHSFGEHTHASLRMIGEVPDFLLELCTDSEESNA
jgi:hypothetical protein